MASILSSGFLRIGAANADIPSTSSIGFWGNAAATATQIVYGTALQSPIYQLRKANGTQASKTAVVLNDTLATFSGGGYSGSSFLNAAGMKIYCDGTVTATSVPQRMAFFTGTGSTDGSTRFERLVVKNDGELRHNFAHLAAGLYDVYASAVINLNGYWNLTSTGGRIGIHTASPTVPLDVTGAILGSSTIEAGTGFKCGGTAAVADGTYTVGARLTPITGTDGTITVKGGIITAITQAT